MKGNKSRLNPNIILVSIAIIVVSLIIGGVIFAVQIQKQQSIEKQQKMEREQEEVDSKAKVELENAKLEQEHKAYNAMRRIECNDILVAQKKLYSNVAYVEYKEEADICLVAYTDSESVDGYSYMPF